VHCKGDIEIIDAFLMRIVQVGLWQHLTMKSRLMHVTSSFVNRRTFGQQNLCLHFWDFFIFHLLLRTATHVHNYVKLK